MSNTSEFLNIIFYVVLIGLGISLIVLTINAIKTMKKLDILLDDISEKSRKLDGVFNVIDSTTNTFVGFSDSVVGLVSKTVGKIFRRKKENNDE